MSENAGVCNARNIGAKTSKGYYITFLDSDDLYVNDKKIENEVKQIKRNNNIAFSQWVRVDENGKIVNDRIIDRNVYNNRYAICKILSISRPVYQQLRGYMFTRQLFERVGGYTFPFSYFEDFDFQCKLVLKGKLKYTKNYGEGYRDAPGGLSKNKDIDSTKVIKLIQNNHYKSLKIDQKLFYKYLLRQHSTKI